MTKDRAPAGESIYVVQVADGGAWKDVATVTVPGRTHRLNVIQRALAEANVELPAGGVEVRVLDERSAARVRVTLHTPEPVFRIG